MIFSTNLSEIFIILRIIARVNMIMYIGLQVKYLLFFRDFNQKWIFFTDFREIIKYQTSWNSSSGSWVVPCRETDRWTDRQTW